MNKVHVAAAVLLVFCGIWSCKEKEVPLTLPEEQDAAIVAYLTENGISLESVTKLDSGVYFYRQREESGPVNLSNIVSFYYILKNLDGQVVHSWQASDGGEPLKAERGSGTIYPPGFDEALQVMSEGDSYVFIFPSHKAYAELPIEGLPANSIVILEVEIVDEESLNEIRQSETRAIDAFVADYVDNNDPDTAFSIGLSGLTIIKTLRDTTAAEVPAVGEVTVNLAGSVLNGAEIYPRSEFIIQRDGEFQVVAGIEEAILRMRLGERALILLPSALAYGPSIQSIPHTIKEMLEEKEIIPGYGVSVSPFTTLVFDVEVLEFQ